VADAAVIRRSDAVWGEVPVAVVAAQKDGLTAADIESICRDLPRYKRPRDVHFIAFEDFPRSTTGKIQRHLLEQQYGSAASR
jgi:fatty-acyl-CoA synthase